MLARLCLVVFRTTLLLLFPRHHPFLLPKTAPLPECGSDIDIANVRARDWLDRLCRRARVAWHKRLAIQGGACVNLDSSECSPEKLIQKGDRDCYQKYPIVCASRAGRYGVAFVDQD